MSDDKKTAEVDDEDTISVPIPDPDPAPVELAAEEMSLNLGDVHAALESVGRALSVVSAEFERLSKLVLGEENTVVHACPPDGSGLTPCCGRSPIDLPLTERISLDGTSVTCIGWVKAFPSS